DKSIYEKQIFYYIRFNLQTFLHTPKTYLIQDDKSSDIIVKFSKFEDVVEILAGKLWNGWVFLTDFETFAFRYDEDHSFIVVSPPYIELFERTFESIEKYIGNKI
ncbi:hypothetical protein, partial [Sebaldella sp. S0638]|uniref:hypothetical protein n=1 Tax=Sebaldella sp. S0638 TaxID=2957809 RepID=UPI00209E5099